MRFYLALMNAKRWELIKVLATEIQRFAVSPLGRRVKEIQLASAGCVQFLAQADRAQRNRRVKVVISNSFSAGPKANRKVTFSRTAGLRLPSFILPATNSLTPVVYTMRSAVELEEDVAKGSFQILRLVLLPFNTLVRIGQRLVTKPKAKQIVLRRHSIDIVVVVANQSCELCRAFRARKSALRKVGCTKCGRISARHRAAGHIRLQLRMGL